MKIDGALVRRLFALLVWLVIGVGSSAVARAALELRVLERDESGTRLSVSNAAVANVNLQGSFDLENWFLLQSATPVLGVATFAHTNTEPVEAWFFRAVAAPVPPVINVGPQSDTNRFVGGMIYPESGGRLEIMDANGVFYQFTVRSNLVTEPTAVRMTIITNFTEMPLTNRFRAAVAFEPDGFEFRGPAELKIRFPEAIPMLEMVGYGFDGSGGDFHLRPWDAATNEVTLAVTHFSGAGVAAVPFSPGNTGNNYERGLTFTRDAIREADNWAGDQYREVSRSRHEGALTQEQANNQRRLIKAQRNVRVYINAIKPLLAAAGRDCEVGQVVLKRLDQLESEQGIYGQGSFYQAALQVAPGIRCLCARYYLELCEKNLAASGNSATRGLDNILDQVALMTGMVDDPNCGLGSNNEIQARMAQAPCHKPWEGTVRYSRVYTSIATIGFADAGGSITTLNTVQEDLTYFGRLTDLLDEEGDTDEDESWQSWTFKLAGKLNANLVESGTTTQVIPEWTVTDTDFTTGVADLAAEGNLILRFDNGSFSTASAAVGLDGIAYRLPLKRTTERVVDCRTKDCPDSIPLKVTHPGNRSLSFAESPNHDDPEAVVTWKDGMLKIVYKQTRREPYTEPATGHRETVETLTIQLFRGSGL